MVTGWLNGYLLHIFILNKLTACFFGHMFIYNNFDGFLLFWKGHFVIYKV